MATPTYDLLDSTVLDSSASSVTFSNIDQSYGDLVLVVEGNRTSSANYAYLQFNGDTGSNYSYVLMGANSFEGDFSFNGSSSDSGRIAYHSTSKNLAVVSIMDYTATDKHKTFLSKSGDPLNDVGAYAFASRWASTSAITSLTIKNGGSFASGNTFSLYGIAK